MEFELKYNEAQEQFRDEVRTWLAANVPDGITARPRSFEESHAIYLQRRELGRKLGAKGWLYPSGEKQYGGGGLDLDRIIVLEEETARLGLGLPPYYDSGGKMGSASIRVWGTEEQKQRFLPPIYRGEVRSWQLLTEPSAGSDLAGVKSTAIRDGDVYVVNGQKIYIGSHHGADRYWTILVTDPNGKRHQNVSWFMIDASLPGIATQPLHMLSAQSEGETDEFGHKNIIFFDNVRVPADCLVGGENNGWKVASTHLEVEHSGQGNIRTNPVWLALLAHCRKQHRDGRPLIEDPDVRAKLAEIFSRLEAVRLVVDAQFLDGLCRREAVVRRLAGVLSPQDNKSLADQGHARSPRPRCPYQRSRSWARSAAWPRHSSGGASWSNIQAARPTFSGWSSPAGLASATGSRSRRAGWARKAWHARTRWPRNRWRPETWTCL